MNGKIVRFTTKTGYTATTGDLGETTFRGRPWLTQEVKVDSTTFVFHVPLDEIAQIMTEVTGEPLDEPQSHPVESNGPDTATPQNASQGPSVESNDIREVRRRLAEGWTIGDVVGGDPARAARIIQSVLDAKPCPGCEALRGAKTGRPSNSGAAVPFVFAHRPR